MKIKQYKMDCNDVHLQNDKHAKNWPVVYILHNQKEAYVGETANFLRRLKEHLDNEKRCELTQVYLIDDDMFNKSAVLDIESELIRLMDADKKYQLQNIVLGQNQAHDYYQRSKYQHMIQEIWNTFYKTKMAKNDYLTVTNSKLFTYSPYKTLTSEQYETAKAILNALGASLQDGKPSVMAVHGCAGTGKSILAVYLFKVLSQIKEHSISKQDLDELEDAGKYEDGMIDVLLYEFSKKSYKIGLVIPVTSFKSTLEKVFSSVNGLTSTMLLTPSDVVNAYCNGEKYDILFIDEAQRLKKPKNVQNYGNYYTKSKELGLHKYASELDWIRLCSDHQIFFYDGKQNVSGADVAIDDLNVLPYGHTFYLHMQQRVKGGDEYMDYIDRILSEHPPQERICFAEYEVIIFDDVKEMYDAILSKDASVGLSRNIAGFAWPWNTKKGKADYDIEIDGHQFVWNRSNKGWITNANTVHEIGSIHTMLGQDLNYAGLIIGKDISYDFAKKKITINKNEFYDVNAKKGLTDAEIKKNILHSYYILLSRARLGVYLYIVDQNFRRYMKQFF